LAGSVIVGARPAAADATAARLVAAARAQVGVTILYDPSYLPIGYPGGDVPLDRGVCTDVIVRAYRTVGLDLQVLVHEDMRSTWEAYPKLWGQSCPDPNIDHRRVPNLATFLRRHGETVAATPPTDRFLAGDLVTWKLPSGNPHIGLVSDRRSAAGAPLVIHNIGLGAREEDVLFAFPITGHYRYPADGARPGLSR